MSEWIEELERLRALKEAGLLSDAEFKAAKARVLSANESANRSPELLARSEQASSDSEQVGEEPFYLPVGVDPPSTWPKIFALVMLTLILGAFSFWFFNRTEVIPTDRFAVAMNSDVNCRKQPTTDAKTNKIILKGDSFAVSEISNGWAKSTADECWVKASNLILRNASLIEGSFTRENGLASSDATPGDLRPAIYDFSVNPDSRAMELARKILTNSKFCVGRPQSEAGTTHAIFDMKQRDVVYVVRAFSGDLLPENEAHFSINDLSLSFVGDGGDLERIDMDVRGLSKQAKGDLILYLAERGSYPVLPSDVASIGNGLNRRDAVRTGWWLRCGDPLIGSEKWKRAFTEAEQTINLVRD